MPGHWCPSSVVAYLPIISTHVNRISNMILSPIPLLSMWMYTIEIKSLISFMDIVDCIRILHACCWSCHPTPLCLIHACLQELYGLQPISRLGWLLLQWVLKALHHESESVSYSQTQVEKILSYISVKICQLIFFLQQQLRIWYVNDGFSWKQLGQYPEQPYAIINSTALKNLWKKWANIIFPTTSGKQ